MTTPDKSLRVKKARSSEDSPKVLTERRPRKEGKEGRRCWPEDVSTKRQEPAHPLAVVQSAIPKQPKILWSPAVPTSTAASSKMKAEKNMLGSSVEITMVQRRARCLPPAASGPRVEWCPSLHLVPEVWASHVPWNGALSSQPAVKTWHLHETSRSATGNNIEVLGNWRDFQKPGNPFSSGECHCIKTDSRGLRYKHQ